MRRFKTSAAIISRVRIPTTHGHTDAGCSTFAAEVFSTGVVGVGEPVGAAATGVDSIGGTGRDCGAGVDSMAKGGMRDTAAFAASIFVST